MTLNPNSVGNTTDSNTTSFLGEEMHIDYLLCNNYLGSNQNFT